MTSPTTSPPVITTDLVLLDTDVDGDKQAVITRLAGSLAAAGRTSDAAGLMIALSYLDRSRRRRQPCGACQRHRGAGRISTCT